MIPTHVIKFVTEQYWKLITITLIKLPTVISCCDKIHLKNNFIDYKITI